MLKFPNLIEILWLFRMDHLLEQGEAPIQANQEQWEVSHKRDSYHR